MNYLMYIAAIFILILVLKVLTFPVRLIGKFVINSIIGGIILYFLAKIGIFIVISWWSLLLAGIFGVPGVIFLIVLSMFM